MAITYYRRYTLASLLSLEALDDDGNTTAGLGNKHKPTTAEVSALIKKGSKKQAREYWKKCDWTNSQELSNKLTSHFN